MVTRIFYIFLYMFLHDEFRNVVLGFRGLTIVGRRMNTYGISTP